jgi:hypothetical protein
LDPSAFGHEKDVATTRHHHRGSWDGSPIAEDASSPRALRGLDPTEGGEDVLSLLLAANANERTNEGCDSGPASSGPASTASGGPASSAATSRGPSSSRPASSAASEGIAAVVAAAKARHRRSASTLDGASSVGSFALTEAERAERRTRRMPPAPPPVPPVSTSSSTAIEPPAPPHAAEDDDEEEIVFLVDITAPQVNFEGKDAAARFLLAASSGRVVGRRARRPPSSPSSPFSPSSPTAAEAAAAEAAAHWGRRVVEVSLQNVQGHVAPTDVDVNAGVQWLDEALFASADGAGAGAGAGAGGKKRAAAATADEFESGSGGATTTTTTTMLSGKGSYLLRQVFKPCEMRLDFTTHIPEKHKKRRYVDDVVDDFDWAAAAAVAGLELAAEARDSKSKSSGARNLDDAHHHHRGGEGPAPPKKRLEALSEFTLRSPELEAELDSDQVRSIQTFFTHPSVSTFNRVPFQLTDEHCLYGTTLSTPRSWTSSAQFFSRSWTTRRLGRRPRRTRCSPRKVGLSSRAKSARRPASSRSLWRGISARGGRGSARRWTSTTRARWPPRRLRFSIQPPRRSRSTPARARRS